MRRKTPIYTKDELPEQSAHKRWGRSPLSLMTYPSLSQKTVTKYFEVAEMMALSKPNPDMGLAENETILLSRLKMDYDVSWEIGNFPSKSPCGRGSWLWGQSLQGLFPGQSSPHMPGNILYGSAPSCTPTAEAVVHRINWINGLLNKRTTI